jgi:hypothetical protein
MKSEHARTKRLITLSLYVALLGLTACTTDAGDGALRLRRPRREVTPSTTPGPRLRERAEQGAPAGQPPPGFLLTSSFERPICGVYQHPKPECEFGVQGDDTRTGPWPSRTGDSSARVQRMSSSHMGILRRVPIPDGNAFVGIGIRVPEIPTGAFPSVDGRDPHIQLLQLTPTDGVLPAIPVELRLFEDRRLGLGVWNDKREAVKSDWNIPVDEWFYVVVEVNNGNPSPQRMWIYDSDDDLVDEVEVSLNTRVEWVHQARTAQKVGGSTSTNVPMFTYYDDWYIARENMGPIHISKSGEVLDQ